MLLAEIKDEQDPEEIDKDTLITALKISNKELAYQLTKLRKLNEAYKELIEELLERKAER